MSSDSDSDEFFDAVDSLPTPVIAAVPQSLCTERQPCDVLKRHQSDELAKQRALEADERRRKLEAMREIMADRSNAVRIIPVANHSLLSSAGNISSGLSTENCTIGLQRRCGSTPNIDILKRQQPDTPSERSNEAEDVVQSVMASYPAATLCTNGDSTQNRNWLPNISVEKVKNKVIPELMVICGDEYNKDRIDGSVPEPEPDIVQSTKSSSLNRQGVMPSLEPVAPPRKKKYKAPPPPLNTEPAKLEPTGLPVDDDTAQMKSPMVDEVGNMLLHGVSLSAELALDIGSATRGNYLVTAVEDLSARAASVCSDVGTDADSTAGDSPESVNAEVLEEANKSQVALTLGMTGHKGEEYSIPLSMKRPRSNSGSRYLSDEEILDKVFVLNLDTGETLPLSSAEEKLPKCINPLSLHIMRRTKEYYSDPSLHKGGNQGDEDVPKDSSSTGRTVKVIKPMGKKKRKLKKFLGKTVHKIKSVADEVFHGEETVSEEDDSFDGRRIIKVKASHSHKGPYDFDLLVPVQELTTQKMSAIWTMKFSQCGRLLATGGQDNLLHVWVLKEAFSYFDDMRRKYSDAAKVSPLVSEDGADLSSTLVDSDSVSLSASEASSTYEEDEHMPFMKQPFCVYRGHSADLLDVSWSKNCFILSSSMDKTVRLWHISRRECLCCFQHIDFVTAIAFHPKDDRYFLSGSLDGKLRLWNIPDKKVALWNEVGGTTKLITAANFCLNGRFAVVGTYDGRCVFYNTEQLKYHTQIHVRSTRGRNARGRKITGVEPYPGEDKILVTSNDSRIRLYDLRDLTLSCKYKGCANNSSQIKASFSHDGRYIICGSEDQSVYIWKTQHDNYKFSSARRDRSDYWESVKAHSAVVTNAIFAPHPELIIRLQFEYVDDEDREASCGVRGEVLVSADYAGVIKVFINKFKPGSGC
jgi:WD40 repeat protein